MQAESVIAIAIMHLAARAVVLCDGDQAERLVSTKTTLQQLISLMISSSDGAAANRGRRADVGETHTRSLVQQTGKQKAQQHLPVALAGDLQDGQGVVGAVASLVKLDVTRQALQTHLQPEKHTSHTSHTSASLAP